MGNKRPEFRYVEITLEVQTLSACSKFTVTKLIGNPDDIPSKTESLAGIVENCMKFIGEKPTTVYCTIKTVTFDPDFCRLIVDESLHDIRPEVFLSGKWVISDGYLYKIVKMLAHNIRRNCVILESEHVEEVHPLVGCTVAPTLAELSLAGRYIGGCMCEGNKECPDRGGKGYIIYPNDK